MFVLKSSVESSGFSVAVLINECFEAKKKNNNDYLLRCFPFNLPLNTVCAQSALSSEPQKKKVRPWRHNSRESLRAARPKNPLCQWFFFPLPNSDLVLGQNETKKNAENHWTSVIHTPTATARRSVNTKHLPGRGGSPQVHGRPHQVTQFRTLLRWPANRDAARSTCASDWMGTREFNGFFPSGGRTPEWTAKGTSMDFLFCCCCCCLLHVQYLVH